MAKVSGEKFREIREDADTIIDACAKRDERFEKLERIYKIAPLGRAEGKNEDTDILLMLDPQGKNVVDSAVRMYVLDRPSISIPSPSMDSEAGVTVDAARNLTEKRRAAERVEKWLNALYDLNEIVCDTPLIQDALFAGFLYGELPIVIDNMLADLPDDADPKDVELPFVLSVPSPLMSYPRYSRRSGLIQHCFKETISFRELEHEYGETAVAFLGKVAGDTEYTLISYADDKYRVDWLDDNTRQPLLAVEHELGFLPRVSRRAGSPGFFRDAEYRQMPLLYAYLEAGLWSGMNRLLTAGFNNVMDFMNPLMLAKMKPGREAKTPDWEKRGSVYQIEQGEDFGALYRSIIPGEYFSMLNTMLQKSEESTMSRYARGVSSTGVTAAAAINILTTVAQMATFPIARMVEFALSAAFRKELMWIHPPHGTPRDYRPAVWANGDMLQIAPSDIIALGKQFHVRVGLKFNMQSMKQMVAGLASSLFNLHAIGYDTFYEMLEEGQIIRSASDAFDDMLMRTMIDAELPKVAKESSEQARRLMQVVESVPRGPEATQPILPVPAAAGMPPNLEQAMMAGAGGGGVPLESIAAALGQGGAEESPVQPTPPAGT